MRPTVDLEVSWEDDQIDLIQISVGATAHGFGGTTQVYSSRRQMLELADQLKNFPGPNNLEVTFEAEDPHLGTLKLHFFCRDLARHPSVLVEITRESQTSNKPPDHASFVVDLEGAAALDSFREGLYSIGGNVHTHAQIIGAAL